MPPKIKLLILFGLAVTAAQANQRYMNWCQEGNRTVNTSGVAGAPKVQASYPQCTVSVYLTGTLTLAAIFSDNSATVKANPFTATVNGSFFFYAANARYDVTISGGGLAAPFTFGDVLLADPAAGSTSVTSVTAGAGITAAPATGPVTVTNTWGAVPTGTQLQALRIQPNTGNNTTYQFSNLLVVVAADYNFTAQQPGGSLVAGGVGQAVTLTPCPVGVAGADTGHYIYLSNGTGVAEATLITGGTCTSGAATGTVTMTPANAHSGAWTLGPVGSGIQEALCALPSSGGEVQVTGSITLLANVSACGKTNASVRRMPGVTISGSFTVLGGPFTPNTATETLYSEPVYATLNNNYDGARHTIGNYPKQDEIFEDSSSNVTALVGAAVATTPNSPNNTVGIAGYSLNKGTAAAIGVVGIGATGAAGGSTWGANFGSNNFSGVAPGTGYLVNLWGIETDINTSYGGTAPASVFGTTVVSAMWKAPTARSEGFTVEKAEVTGHAHYPFGTAFRANHGAATTALDVGARSLQETATKTFATLPAAVAGTNTAWRCTDCQQTTPCLGGGTGAIAQGVSGAWDCSSVNAWSQEISMHSITATTGATTTARTVLDGGGNLSISGAGGIIQFEVSPGAPVASIRPNGAINIVGVAFASLGSSGFAQIQWCNNCNVASPCTGGGAGAWAFANGTSWKCPF